MKKLTVVLSIILCLSLVGCSQPTVMEQVFSELVKEEYTGRLVGTEGNEKAGQYLEDLFVKLKIEPFSHNSYKMRYSQMTADPNEQNTKMIITYKNGSKKELVHGKDFYTNAATKAIDIDLPLEFDAKKSSSRNIPIFNSDDIVNIKKDDPSEVWIMANDKPLHVVGTPEGVQKFKISISDTLRAELQKEEAVSAKITCDYVPKDHSPYNVVGVIRGNEDSKKAIAITAHYDHVGKQGDFFFTGMLDNASGTATLMSVAQKLTEITKDKNRDYDIVLAAVNSEETNAQLGDYEGSINLARVLSRNYTDIVNVNIDCVGLVSAPELEMGLMDGVNDGVVQKFRDKLSADKIPMSDKKYTAGDHISFSDLGYPAFTVGGVGDDQELVHSPTWQKSDFNLEHMESIAKAVAEFVADGDTLFAKPQQAETVSGKSSEEELTEKIKIAFEKQMNGSSLALNQQMYFQFEDQYVWTGSDGLLTDYAQIKKYYPTVDIPQSVGEFAFENVNFASGDMPYFSMVDHDFLPKDAKLNEAFEVKLAPENISIVNLTYQKDGRQLCFYTSRKREGQERHINEENKVLELELPYEGLSLVSNVGTEEYYSIQLEQDGFWVNVTVNEKDGEGGMRFSKEEMLKLIDEIGLAE